MILHIDDQVEVKTWSGTVYTAKVLGIEICRDGFKEGRAVKQVDLDKNSNIVIDLDNNHWCYGYQIKQIFK